VVTIAALVCDRASRTRLQGAVRGQAEFSFCNTVPELISAVVDGAATAVVTEWRDAVGCTLEDAVRSLHADFPTVPILVYAPLTPQGARDMLEAARAGATEVLIANFDDVGITLAKRLASAQAVVLAGRIMAQIAELVPASVAVLIDYFLRHGSTAPSVATAAHALGLHRKTLALYCARAQLPSPSALACWARLILAAQRLEDPGRTTERAAREVGFPSGSAFRNMLTRYTGLSPSEVRERGGSLCLIDLFSARLAAGHGHRAAKPRFDLSLPPDDI
jgi:AraC-like DNA-binding protein